MVSRDSTGKCCLFFVRSVTSAFDLERHLPVQAMQVLDQKFNSEFVYLETIYLRYPRLFNSKLLCSLLLRPLALLQFVFDGFEKLGAKKKGGAAIVGVAELFENFLVLG